LRERFFPDTGEVGHGERERSQPRKGDGECVAAIAKHPHTEQAEAGNSTISRAPTRPGEFGAPLGTAGRIAPGGGNWRPPATREPGRTLPAWFTRRGSSADSDQGKRTGAARSRSPSGLHTDLPRSKRRR
ncbi:hypothetical protein KC19_2G197300, partial [Ceratodon purpureus]